MTQLDFVSTTRENAAPDDLLKLYDGYIYALVYKKMQRPSFNHVLSGRMNSELEVDEIAQHVRIKLWQALSRRRIQHPKAYINAIVQHELIDMARRQKFLPLPVDEEGELSTGTMIFTSQEGMNDPATECEQAETVTALTVRAVDAVLSLPPRQRQAMIASLAEWIDDFSELEEACKKRHLDIRVNWPTTERERQSLRASLSIARKRLEHAMNIEPSARIGTQKAPVEQSHVTPVAREHESLAQESDMLGETGIEACIDQLREPYRTAVYLHCVEKRSYQQIVDELNLPIGTVKSQISRGVKMLRRRKEPGPDRQQGKDIAEIVARVGMLQEPYRTPVELHYVQKRTYPQIALQLNLPKGTVKSYISRGIKMLREPASLSHPAFEA
jgi:RNA polymerase sigma-70 factor (ECF subfamily)